MTVFWLVWHCSSFGSLFSQPFFLCPSRVLSAPYSWNEIEKIKKKTILECKTFLCGILKILESRILDFSNGADQSTRKGFLLSFTYYANSLSSVCVSRRRKVGNTSAGPPKYFLHVWFFLIVNKWAFFYSTLSIKLGTWGHLNIY